jgi:hypothetical protein
MNLIYGNLWDQECDALVILTNGFIKRDGSCVMGRGCAKEAADIDPGLPMRLGAMIQEHGNRCLRLGRIDGSGSPFLVSFPVKPVHDTYDGTNAVAHMAREYIEGERVPGWACKARPDIILRSAKQLVAMADKFGWQRIVIPRPGCGAGELLWDDVEPILAPVLDDRFDVISFRP